MNSENALELLEKEIRETPWWKIHVYYPLWRAWQKPGQFWDDIVAFVQRGKRGYADSDCWGLNFYLSSFMPEALSRMRDETKGGGNSYPGERVKGAETFEKWAVILQDIAEGFKAEREINELWYEEGMDYKEHVRKVRRLRAKQKKGLLLFAKYYSDLWD